MGSLIFLLIVIFIVYMAWTTIISPGLTDRRASKQVEAQADAPWDVQEIHRNQSTFIEIVRPGNEPQQIGEAIPHNLPPLEYEAKVDDLWIEAEELCAGKNRRLAA